MGIGATAVVFMLANGASLQDIAMVKIVQGIFIFFLEVPTGIFADTWGRKTSIIGASLSAILSFAAFFWGRAVPWFYVAEMLNALAIAFWSGAFQALVVDSLSKNLLQGNHLDYLFSKMGTFSSGATMIGGYIGGLIADINPGWPFLFSIFLMICCLLFVALLVKEKNPQETARKKWKGLKGYPEFLSKNLKFNIRASIHKGLMNSKLRLFFYLQIASQFALQPVFHYWQPYFKSFDSNLPNSILGTIFLGYVGAHTVYLGFSSKLLKHKLISPNTLIQMDFIIMILAFGTMVFSNSLLVAVTSFLIMQGSNAGSQALLAAEANKVIPSEQRATILSNVSLISRVGMLISLGIIRFIVKYVDIQKLYFMSLIATIVMILLYQIWKRDNA